MTSRSTKDELLEGAQALGRDYRVHLDGYNFLPYLTGETDASPRNEIFYFSDDGDLTALRYRAWRIIFCRRSPPASASRRSSASCCRGWSCC